MKTPFRTKLPGDPGGAKPRWPVVATSAALHGALLVGILAIPDWRHEDDGEREPIDIVFYPPERERPKPPPPEPREPEPVEVAEEAPPEIEPPPIEAPVRAPVVEPPVARHEPPPRPRVAPPEPPVRKPPKREIRKDLFAEERAPVERKAPVRQTRTGSFATAEADAAQRRRRTVSDVGGFEATSTQAPGPESRNSRVVAAGGFSTGDVSVPRRSERRAVRVDTAAFDESAAQPAVATTRPGRKVSGTGFEQAVLERPAAGKARGSVSQGGFGDGERAAPRKKRARPVADLDSPVEVVSKPTPVYTAEARELRIEGEVVLEVTFFASGKIRVNRIVDGLGHGLDEAARKAAEKIEFTPARRDGKPVDHTATLRVVFRLA